MRTFCQHSLLCTCLSRRLWQNQRPRQCCRRGESPPGRSKLCGSDDRAGRLRKWDQVLSPRAFAGGYRESGRCAVSLFAQEGQIPMSLFSCFGACCMPRSFRAERGIPLRWRRCPFGVIACALTLLLRVSVNQAGAVCARGPQELEEQHAHSG